LEKLALFVLEMYYVIFFLQSFHVSRCVR